MKQAILNKFFWKEFSKNLLIGLSLFILTLGIYVDSDSLTKRGPSATLAQESGTFDLSDFGDADYNGGYFPIDDGNSNDSPGTFDLDQYFGGNTETEPSYQEPYNETYSGGTFELTNYPEISYEGGYFPVSYEPTYEPYNETYSGGTFELTNYPEISYEGEYYPISYEPYDPYNETYSGGTFELSDYQNISYEGEYFPLYNEYPSFETNSAGTFPLDSDYETYAAGNFPLDSGYTYTPSTYEPVTYSPPTYTPITYNPPVYNPPAPVYTAPQAPTYEGPGCVGNRSVWAIWTGSDFNTAKTVERDYGVVPGECGNPYMSNIPAFAAQPAGAPSQNTYVTNNIDNSSLSTSNSSSTSNPTQSQSQTVNLAVNPPASPAQNLAQPIQVFCSPSLTMVNINQPVTWSAQGYGGEGALRYQWTGTDGLSGTSSNIQFVYKNPGLKDARVIVTDSKGQQAQGICSQVSVTVPPVDRPIPANNPVGGNFYDQLNPCPVGMYPTNNGQCYDPNLPNQPQPVVVTGGVTPSPTATQTPAATQAPATDTKGGVSQPQVTGQASTGAKELPKTGLPLAAIGLSGLLPLGWKLKKFMFGLESLSSDHSANSLWMKRQLERED